MTISGQRTGAVVTLKVSDDGPGIPEDGRAEALRRGGRLDERGSGAGLDPRDEIDDLDLDASVEDSVTVVEWGDGMVERLADAHLRVRIERRDDDTRLVTLEPRGGDWAARLAALG